MSDEIRPGYTRVSEILGQWDKFGGIPEDVLKHKSDIGTTVHKAIHEYLKDGLFAMNADAEGYFESFQKWHDTMNPLVIQLEQRLYCDKLKITGQIDGIFNVNGKFVIFDYKTSASALPKIWHLQGAFYYHLAIQNDLKAEPEVHFLQLKKDGKPPKLHTFVIDKEALNVMMSAYNCYKWLKSP